MLVESKNHGEALIHATEKSVKEHGDKVQEADKQGIETAIEALRQALAGDDAEVIKSRTTDLMQASMKLGEAAYMASPSLSEACASALVLALIASASSPSSAVLSSAIAVSIAPFSVAPTLSPCSESAFSVECTSASA